MACYKSRTPTGIRVGPVYTPPEHRRRGYAGAVTAAVSQVMLDRGRAFVCLYTDAANPTSNHVYESIGRGLADSMQYRFTQTYPLASAESLSLPRCHRPRSSEKPGRSPRAGSTKQAPTLPDSVAPTWQDRSTPWTTGGTRSVVRCGHHGRRGRASRYEAREDSPRRRVAGGYLPSVERLLDTGRLCSASYHGANPVHRQASTIQRLAVTSCSKCGASFRAGPGWRRGSPAPRRPSWPDSPPSTGRNPSLSGSGWVFPTGIMTHVLLVAGLRNPTVRPRYETTRDLLAEHDRLDLHERLLNVLGSRAMSPEQAARHLDAIARIYDAATRFPVARIASHPISRTSRGRSRSTAAAT